MGEVFAKFYEKESNSDLHKFFRTHPLSKSRVRNTLQYKIGSSRKFDTVNVDWDKFKKRILTNFHEEHSSNFIKN